MNGYVVSVLAVLILFIVTNWVFHKMYWVGWNAKLRDLSKSARQVRAPFWEISALVGVGFLTVYREGFETTIFMQSLILGRVCSSHRSRSSTSVARGSTPGSPRPGRRKKSQPTRPSRPRNQMQITCINVLPGLCRIASPIFIPSRTMNRSTTPLACLFAGITLVFQPLSVSGQAQPEAPVLPTNADASIIPQTTTATPAAPAGLTDTAETGFLDQDLMTGDWGGFRKKLEDDGFKFSPTYIGEVFGNPSGGASQGTIYDNVVNLPVDFDLDRMSDGAVKDLTLHANAYWIAGDSLSQSFVHDFSVTSNIASYNTVRLQELWLQKWLWDKRVSIKVGNIAIDTEFFQSSSASLFINSTFGTPDIIANNVPNAPVYPVASPGVRIQFLPTSNFYAMAAVFGSDNKSVQDTNNQNGTRFALTGSSGMLIMSEVGYLVNQSPNDRGLQGSYRLGSFVQTANYPSLQSQGDFATGNGNLRGNGSNYGIYGVMDQQIYANADNQAISLFVRAGGAPSDTNFVDYYVDGGFNFNGFIPGRANDIAGIAVARAHVSHDFSSAQVAMGNAPYTAETVLEATYKVQLAPWWSVQPDFQYIITPSGEPGLTAHNAVVLGLRTNVAF